MRRLLLAFGALFLLVLIGTACALFVFRDQLLLSQLRSRTAALAPLRLEVGGLSTEILGPLRVRLSGLELSRDGVTLKVREAELASPLSAWAVYRAYADSKELPLSVSLLGAVLALPEAKPSMESPAKESDWPAKIELPALPPVPLRAELLLKDGEVSGPFRAKGIQAGLRLDSAAAGFSVGGKLSLQASLPGADALLPVAADLKLAGTQKQLKLEKAAVNAAGIDAVVSGELDLAPVVARFKLDASVPDLSKLSLRQEDRAALGLSAQPAGAFTLKLAGVAKESGLQAGGQLKLSEASLPLRLPEKTIFSAAMAGAKLDGTVRVHAEAPSFLVELPRGGKGAAKLSGSLAGSVDLSGARVAKEGLLAKPAGVPLRAELRASLDEKAVKIESLSAGFHHLRMDAAGEVAQPFGEPAARVVSGTFRAEAKSLAGFPALLPILREQNASGASLDEAQGSVLAEGRARLLPLAPAKSFVELRALSLKGVRLPLAYRKEKIAATGLLLASLEGAGKYDAGALDVARGEGRADLTGLNLELPGLVKKQGKKLLVAFDARGNPSKLQLRKASLEAAGLSASLSGSVSTAVKGRADLALSAAGTAELNPLREYLPTLPFKVSNGSLGFDARIGGAWLFDVGVEKSPLLVSASARGKVGSVEMPEPPAAGASPAEKKNPEPLLPPWPVARKLRLGYRFELANFRRGKLEAAGVVAEGNLVEGKFTGSASVAKTFGGSARLTSLQGDLTEAALPVRGAASADGMDLSRMAGFVDPSYGELVKGTLKADCTFAVPDVFAENLMHSATAKGKAEIKNGYVSTASVDTMVNAKLAGLPGVGDKAKVKTGGMAADMRTNFEASGGVIRLTDFFAVTPRRDEMRMGGTLDLAFNADMKGEARLVDAPVRGAVREANSDEQGRLVVPIVFRGNLKSPSVDIANETIELMLGKTAKHEAEKLKSKAVDEGKKKLEEEAKKAGQDLLKGIFKR